MITNTEIINRNRGASLLLSWAENRKSYRKFADKVNRNLPDRVTTYYARHSWATIAALLDAANRRVIDFVLYGKTD